MNMLRNKKTVAIVWCVSLLCVGLRAADSAGGAGTGSPPPVTGGTTQSAPGDSNPLVVAALAGAGVSGILSLAMLAGFIYSVLKANKLKKAFIDKPIAAFKELSTNDFLQKMGLPTEQRLLFVRFKDLVNKSSEGEEVKVVAALLFDTVEKYCKENAKAGMPENRSALAHFQDSLAKALPAEDRAQLLRDHPAYAQKTKEEVKQVLDTQTRVRDILDSVQPGVTKATTKQVVDKMKAWAAEISEFGSLLSKEDQVLLKGMVDGKYRAADGTVINLTQELYNPDRNKALLKSDFKRGDFYNADSENNAFTADRAGALLESAFSRMVTLQGKVLGYEKEDLDAFVKATKSPVVDALLGTKALPNSGTSTVASIKDGLLNTLVVMGVLSEKDRTVFQGLLSNENWETGVKTFLSVKGSYEQYAPVVEQTITQVQQAIEQAKTLKDTVSTTVAKVSNAVVAGQKGAVIVKDAVMDGAARTINAATGMFQGAYGWMFGGEKPLDGSNGLELEEQVSRDNYEVEKGVSPEHIVPEQAEMLQPVGLSDVLVVDNIQTAPERNVSSEQALSREVSSVSMHSDDLDSEARSAAFDGDRMAQVINEHELVKPKVADVSPTSSPASKPIVDQKIPDLTLKLSGPTVQKEPKANTSFLEKVSSNKARTPTFAREL